MPLNLKRRFSEYRVERNPRGEYRIRCHHGFVTAMDADRLLAVVDDPKIIKKMAKHPLCVPEYDEDTFSFDADDFDEIAAIMRPVRRD